MARCAAALEKHRQCLSLESFADAAAVWTAMIEALVGADGARDEVVVAAHLIFGNTCITLTVSRPGVGRAAYRLDLDPPEAS